MAGPLDPQLVAALLGNSGAAWGSAQNAQQNYQQQQLNQLKIAEAQREEEQARAYQQDVAAYSANPTTNGLSALSVKYPAQWQAFTQSWKIKSAGQRQSDLSTYGGALAAVRNGKADVAAQVLRQRRDAEQAAGSDTTQLDQWLGALESGEADALKATEGGLLALVAASDPEKAFADTLETLGGTPGKSHVVSAGGSLVDDQGNELYRAPEKVEYERVTNADGSTSLVAVGGTGGHGPAAEPVAGSGRTPAGAADGSFGTYLNKFLFPQEGGYVARDGRSGAAAKYGINGRANPGVDIANLTKQQAGQIYQNKYWRASGADKLPAGLAEIQMDTAVNAGVGTAKRLLQQSGGDPQRYLQLREQYFRGLNQPENLDGWLRRNADLAAYTSVPNRPVSAATEVYRSAGGKPGYTQLTPAEAESMGLDRNTVYQRSPTGQVSPIGGQRKPGGGKALPPKVLDAIASNSTQVRQIDRMLALLDPSNKAPEARAARYSIGASNRVVPAWVAQYTDSAGEDFRSQIGRTGGIIIKDISGAAVSASEDNRLARWVPLPTDNAAAALSKLRNLRRGILETNSSIKAVYGPENGYQAYQAPRAGGRAAAPAPRPAAGVPSGFRIVSVRNK